MKKIKYHIISFVMLSLLSTMLLVGYANANSGNVLIPDVTLECVLWTAAQWLMFIAIFVALVVVVVAGILWAVSAGDDEKVTAARKWVTNGLVGLIITLAAYAIVTFVVDKIFGNIGIDMTQACA